MALLACLPTGSSTPLLLATGVGEGTTLESANGLLYARVNGNWVSIDGQGHVATNSAPPPGRTTTGPGGATCPSMGGHAAPRATATDHGGRTFVACASDEEGRAGAGDYVYRVDGDAPLLVGARAGTVVAMSFGSGGLLAPQNLYLLQSGGSIVYLRPP